MCGDIIGTTMTDAPRMFMYGDSVVIRGDDGAIVRIHYSSIEPIAGTGAKDELKGAQDMAEIMGLHTRDFRIDEMNMPPGDVAVIFAKVGDTIFSTTLVDPDLSAVQKAYIQDIPPELLITSLIKQMGIAIENDMCVELAPVGDGLQMRRVPREIIEAEREKYRRLPPAPPP
jgi:hypothetical protein